MSTIMVDTIAQVLFGKTRQSVLSLLFTRPDESFHLRQISRLTGSSPGAVQRDLADLTAAGLLTRRTQGNQTLYSPNPDSPVYPDLRNLIIKTTGLAHTLRHALAPLASQIDCAFLYGSFAKGDHHAASDVDLLVIGTISFADLARHLAPAQRLLQRDINPTLYPPTEFAAKLATHHHFLTQVTAGPKVFLLGAPNDLDRLTKPRLAPSPPNLPARNRRPPRRRRP